MDLIVEKATELGAAVIAPAPQRTHGGAGREGEALTKRR